MSCGDCNKNKDTEKEVSWAVVELINGTHEREKRRNWIERIILIAIILITNLLWLLFFLQFDFESYNYEQDGNGNNINGNGNNIIGDDNRSYIDGPTTDYQEETEEKP